MVDIAENDRRKRYIVTDPAGQSVFDIDFPLDSRNGISLYVNGVVVSEAGYVIDDALLKITTTSPVAKDSVVVIDGNTSLQRTYNYPPGGGLSSEELNREFSDIVFAMQEMRRDMDRLLTLPILEEVDVSAILEKAQAGYAIGWDATGKRLVNLFPASGAAVINSNISAINTVAGQIAQITALSNLSAEILALYNIRDTISGAGDLVTQAVAAAASALANAALLPKQGSGASAPTVNHDSTQGYSIGSPYYVTAAGSEKTYRCFNPAVGAAVWVDEGLGIDDLGDAAILDLSEILDAAYPIGKLYITETNENPSVTFGFGTWTAVAEGKLLCGVGTGTDINDVENTFTVGETGGEYNHTLITAEMPEHTHTVSGQNRAYRSAFASASSAGTGWANGSTTSSETGGGAAHNNMPPYEAYFIWKRTA